MATVKRSWGYGLPDQAYAPEVPAAVKPATRLRWLPHLHGDLSGGFVAGDAHHPRQHRYLLASAGFGERLGRVVGNIIGSDSGHKFDGNRELDADVRQHYGLSG